MQIEQTLHELFWNPTDLASLPSLVLRLIVAAVLGILLGEAYVHFGQSLSNRKLFARNFIVLTVTTALIISIVRSSVALSLGLVGALSIVRFRAAIKEPEELAFLFLAISAGLGLCVNNLYLDSLEFRDYHDHVNGVAHRSKTRLRWYGAWSGRIATPSLEHKLKCGLVSGKVSHRLPPLSMNGHVSRPDLEAAFDGANLPELARLALHHLQPSLLNRYQRQYFQSADGRFRLTVDSDLQFAAARQAQ